MSMWLSSNWRRQVPVLGRAPEEPGAAEPKAVEAEVRREAIRV